MSTEDRHARTITFRASLWPEEVYPYTEATDFMPDIKPSREGEGELFRAAVDFWPDGEELNTDLFPVIPVEVTVSVPSWWAERARTLTETIRAHRDAYDEEYEAIPDDIPHEEHSRRFKQIIERHNTYNLEVEAVGEVKAWVEGSGEGE
jgi:hypothetical protein